VDIQPGTKTTFDGLQSQSALVLFRLVKALQGMEGASRNTPNLKVITNYATYVRESDALQPYTASVLGFARAVAREFPQFSTEIIDIDFSTEASVPRRDLHVALRYVIDGIDGHREF